MPTDAMTLKRIDHVPMFVDGPPQSAYFYRNAFGFQVIAYGGLETGMKQEACYVLRQGQMTFVLASPLIADHPDGPNGSYGTATAFSRLPWKSMMFRRRSRRPWAWSTARVAPAHPPGRAWRHRHGRDPRLWRYHTFASRPLALPWRLCPRIQTARSGSVQARTFHPVGLRAIDHIVANVEEGEDGRLGRVLQQDHGLFTPGEF